jgi:DNA replicative helicase MCM subunit Mcm2 (Cdc46/Mcm family)
MDFPKVYYECDDCGNTHGLENSDFFLIGKRWTCESCMGERYQEYLDEEDLDEEEFSYEKWQSNYTAALNIVDVVNRLLDGKTTI